MILEIYRFFVILAVFRVPWQLFNISKRISVSNIEPHTSQIITLYIFAAFNAIFNVIFRYFRNFCRSVLLPSVINEEFPTSQFFLILNFYSVNFQILNDI